MLGIDFHIKQDSALQVLCLGAHSDDIEIGCGGTILRLIEEHSSLRIHWIVFSAPGDRAREARESADSFLEGVGEKNIVVMDHRDGFFPYYGEQIKEYFENLRQSVSPDVIFTHYRHDLHQDHRLVCELTWNTFRNHLILEYEIPKFDGDLGSPNFFIPLNKNICGRKVEYILAHFRSQENRHWFSKETFFSIMRLRGVESRAPEGYAEAYYCQKIILKGINNVGESTRSEGT
jgi:LmbE family N-acetylglucosaminyl deacetylase